MNTTVNRETLIQRVLVRRSCTAWDLSVNNYALIVLGGVKYLDELPRDRVELQTALLKGAKNWRQYAARDTAFSGDENIAKYLYWDKRDRVQFLALCKEYPGYGRRMQHRALCHAFRLIADEALRD